MQRIIAHYNSKSTVKITIIYVMPKFIKFHIYSTIKIWFEKIGLARVHDYDFLKLKLKSYEPFHSIYKICAKYTNLG